MLKRYLPRGFYGRALIILLTPVVVAQFVGAFVFFDRHLETVSRRLARAVVGDLQFVSASYRQFPDAETRFQILAMASKKMNMQLAELPGETLPVSDVPFAGNVVEQQLFDTLRVGLGPTHAVQRRAQEKAYWIFMGTEDGLLKAIVPMNRFTASTAHIFILWMVGSSLLLLAVAIVFLRNQVRPIRELALAADSFGKGQEVERFKPSGATEIRQAGMAFNQMRERIQRQIRQRTEMLAGVSHDLRTPLTRMKLQLALLPESPETVGLKADVEEMEQMIAAYLAFARGAEGEAAVRTDVAALLRGVVRDARQRGARVDVSIAGDLVVSLRAQALKRCVTNLVDNAGRHGKNTHVSAERREDAIFITVDDDGPGIPAEERDAVFRPFYRIDGARGPDDARVGLGLAIARDTVRSHGGDVTLDDAPGGGLRASVRLPI